MGNVSGSYSSLLGGVSQQPAVVRAEGQCEDLLNGMLRPVDGLTDREPFVAVGKLPGMTSSMRLHHWDAGDGNQYLVGVGGGQIKVWDWAGNPMSVTVDAAATAYIAAFGDKLHTANVGDYLMISNNTVVVQAGAAVGAPADTPTFWIKNVRWGQRIAVWANVTVGASTKRFEFAYTSPDGTISTDSTGSDTSKANTKFIDPSYVVWRWYYWITTFTHPADFSGPEQWADMKHSLATVVVTIEAGISDQYQFAFDGSTFSGPRMTVPDQTVSAVGTDNPEGDVVAVFRTVSSVDELPPRSYDGHVVEVSQDDTGDFSFYMKFEAESQSTPPGTTPIDEWECLLYPDFGEYDIGFGANTASGSMTNTQGTPVGNISAFYIYHDGARDLRLNCTGQWASVTVRCAGQLVTLTPDGGSFAYKAEDQNEIYDAMVNAHNTGQPLSVYFRDPTPVQRASPAQTAAIYSGIPSGKWRETYKPGIQTSLNALTMPHALVRTSPTAFHFIPLDGRQIPSISFTESWVARTVGDDDSNPLPDFVGGTIRGIGVYKDRMYLYGGESMRFSKIGLYWDLFIESAVEGGDDDGFDVTTVTGKVQNIRYTVPHQQSLVVFAEQGQFIMDGSQVLSPNTAALIPVTSFILNHDVEPKASGDVVYFTDRNGKYSNIREFYLDSITATNNARPITQHVDHMIPAGVRQLVSSAEDNILFVIPTEGSGKMWVYQYVMDNGQRLQSAWHPWELSVDIPQYGWVHRGILHLVVLDMAIGEYVIGTIDLQSSVVSDFEYMPRLDGLRTGVGSGRTLYLGDSVLFWNSYQYILVDGPYKGTQIYPIGVDDPNRKVIFADDITGMTVAYGQPYPFRFEPTRPFPLDKMGRRITDRLTLLQFIAEVENTGPFDAVISSDYYPDFRIPADRVLGSNDALLGETPVMSGRSPIMLNMNVDYSRVRFEKLHPQPFNLVYLDYRGRYTQRSTRI